MATRTNTAKTSKPKVFYCYFWKSFYRRTKKHQWVIQYKGKKHIVNSFKVLVPTESKSRKRNPHAVLWGKARTLKIKNGHATLE